jgi:uncharacterized protein YutE (UPF0331/DUF86 family)
LIKTCEPLSCKNWIATCRKLDRYLSQLRKHQGVTAEKLDNDLDKAWIVERGLQLSIQLVLDIGNHILAEEGSEFRFTNMLTFCPSWLS